MKNAKWLFGAAIVGLGFVSCKSEKEKNAERKVETYTVYVDSLEKIDTLEAHKNWEAIAAAYEIRTAEAEASLEDMKDKMAAEEKLNASKAKYEILSARHNAKMSVDQKDVSTSTLKQNPNQLLRNRFFGEGKVGEDMSFGWVNKDNILKVYDNFFTSYKENKGNFSREDFDEVKLMYEALDSRKNTVEKEGLSSEDNTKIASIKFKFSAMFKVNRIGAKARENEKSKE